MDSSGQLVVVTGASGFIALHCVQQLLQAGYRVRGTLRSLQKEAEVRAALKLDPDQSARLEFVAADLLQDAGWSQAMASATYVLHVASPFPPAPPKHVDDLVRPAKEGTVRVLSAASEARVRRVVVTSSIVAIHAGHDASHGRTFTESDWSNLSGPVSAYDISKIRAEQAAWDYVETLPKATRMELVTINPSAVMGPSLLGADNTSNELVGKLLRREVPGVPRIHLPIVDVRDVASSHLRAMTVPEAAGQRFIVSGAEVWYSEFAVILKQAGYRVPSRELPDWLVRLVSLFDGTVRLIVPILGQPLHFSTDRARSVLGWTSRPLRETVLDAAADISSRL